ncbi:efflux RND transporter periplasmic adaptor subunit [Brucella sp. HL-2]|nr:efflux RND transporter periplasmic adaptor subunit [Brucella sp. HL-2]MCV9909738.1 efflux RND transporter periplasmic adaptor subunit [Brucella sp. HL-2]
MTKRFLGASILAVLIALYPLFVSRIAIAQQVQAPPVITQTVEKASSAAPLRFNGQIEAIESVDIQARITGFLKQKTFEQGAAVKAGDLLFEIEPDQMAAALAQVEAQVARAQAAQNAARQSLSRTRTLANRNTASQASLDDAQASFDIASADVQSAEAARNTARLNLSYTRVRSPINGTIGRSLFTVGNLVGPTSGPLARIVQLDPVRIVFSITDRALTDLRQKEAQGGRIDPESFRLTLKLSNGTEYEEEGRIQFIDNEVNVQTGTVAVRAIFGNKDHLLVPGQIVAVTLLDETAVDLPIIPMSSVLQDREGKYVFVLNAGNTVSRRAVITGARLGNNWSVAEGLKAGETIVVEGLQRIMDGQSVEPHDHIAGEVGTGQ